MNRKWIYATQLNERKTPMVKSNKAPDFGPRTQMMALDHRVYRFSSNPKATKDGVVSQVNDPVWNSLEIFNGKNYRQRVEALVFNDKGEILLSDNSENYKVLGGSTEKGMTMEQALMKEANEEALISIENLEFANIRYTLKFDRYWKEVYRYYTKTEFEGAMSYVYTAKYAGDFGGKIREVDKDKDVAKSKWFKVEDVYHILREPHRIIIDRMKKK
jgi:ADP-ribose pyrophosphatase YjhB (NUDIX family)